MLFRLMCTALALCAAAGVAHAELEWDGVVNVPAAQSGVPNRYLVCPAESSFAVLNRDNTDCMSHDFGAFTRATHSIPKLMSLQQALDLHFKAPAGTKAVALGPQLAYGRNGPDSQHLGIAYKLVKQ